MKKSAFLFFVLIAASQISLAQCGKKFTIISSKTDHLDSKGNLTRTVDEKAVVVINPTNVFITINDDHEINGIIKTDTCNWQSPYKEGKTIIKTSVHADNGEDKNVTITITGKDGKITLLYQSEDEPDDTIRVIADKFEETI